MTYDTVIDNLHRGRRLMSLHAGLFTLFIGAMLSAAVNAQTPSEIAAETLKSKFALVIGNGKYDRSPLANPVNDATDVAESLRAIGFDVTLAVDLKLDAMRVEIEKFAAKLPDSAAALVFFAGHGVQHAGRNYLLGIDAVPNIKSPTDLETHAVPLSDLVSQITLRKNAISVFILDSCRNSPFDTLLEIKSGLARTVPPPRSGSLSKPQDKTQNLEGTLIAYSTAPHATAADGGGRNSPYSKHLKDALRRPNSTLETILKLTRSSVTAETNGIQTPWYESSINGDFYPAGRGRIEFDELLKLFVPPLDPRAAAYAPNTQEWDLGSSEASPITWRHHGTQEVRNQNTVRDFTGKSWGPLTREGEVIITINGVPTLHKLLERLTPVPWKITMIGAGANVFAVSITSNMLTREFGGFGSSRFLKEGNCTKRTSFLDYTTVYSVVIPGRVSAWLAERSGCGSTGYCSHDYQLFYNPMDRRRFGCGG